MTTLPTAMSATRRTDEGDQRDRMAVPFLPRYALEHVSGDVEVRVDRVDVVLILEPVDQPEQLRGAVLVERDEALGPVRDLGVLDLDAGVGQRLADGGQVGRL